MSREDRFFARNGLCALNLDEACPTYRPDHPDGLRPRARCASCSARSAAVSPPGPSRPPRSRPRCTAEALPAAVQAAPGGSGQKVRITVLGKSPAWQDADGACSGYLVEGGGRTVLLDCGPGVFAKLRYAGPARAGRRGGAQPPARRPRDGPRPVRVRHPLPAVGGAAAAPEAVRAARRAARCSRGCARAAA